MRKTILGSLMLTAICIGAVGALMLLSTSDIPQIVTSFGARGWNTIASAQEGGGLLTAGGGGVLQVYVWKHAANPGVTYNANLSNVSADCYAHANNLNAAMTGNVPYGTAFDIVYKIRVNVTEAWNTTSGSWMASWVRCNITIPALGVAADSAMTGISVATDGTWMWMNFYWNQGGTGAAITHGAQVNITSFKLQCYM